MKKILIILTATVLFISCGKEQLSNKVLIKVEAIHTTGEVITSNTISVK